MGKTNYHAANQRLVLTCIFPEPHDSSHRGSRALATRLRYGQEACAEECQQYMSYISMALIYTYIWI